MEHTIMHTSTSTSIHIRHVGRLKQLAVYGVVLGSACFLFGWYDAIPSCASGRVRESIQSTVRHALRANDRNAVPALPTVLKAREIGHATARRERGCVATVRAGEELLSYAYIVSPRDSRKVKFEVTQAHHLLVAARFGNLDRDGDFAHKAAPIGRDNLERALHAALDTPNLFTTRSSISQVEPLGACRAMGGEGRYACRVMLQLGSPAQDGARTSFGIIQAEFTFERGAGQPEWRAAGDTYGRYLRAVLVARKTPRPMETAPAMKARAR